MLNLMVLSQRLVLVFGFSQSLITGVEPHPSGITACPFFSQLLETLSLLFNCVTLRVLSLATGSVLQTPNEIVVFESAESVHAHLQSVVCCWLVRA